MSKPNVKDRTPISLAELNDEIKRISERDEELNYRAGKTEEYVNDFADLDKDEFDDAFEAINDLDVPRLKDKHIIKIIDFLPETTDDLDVILEGYPLTINNENKEAIIDAISDHAA